MLRIISSIFSRKQEHRLKTLYLALVVLSLHWSLVMYINSSFLEQFVSEAEISLLYTVASLLALIFFYFLSDMLRKLGNFNLLIFLTLVEIGSLFGMAFSTTSLWAIVFFIAHYIVVPLILFCLDVLIEDIIGSQEKRTGMARGLYLTLLSLAIAIGPAISGYFVTDMHSNSFSNVYITSALIMLLFIAIVTFYFKDFKDPTYPRSSLKDLIRIFVKERDMRNVFIAQFHLRFFFTWMIIFSPLYLAKIAGFNWTEIGYILFVSLMSFAIFSYPIGVIADKHFGEKEMMAFGFFLIAVCTSWLSFLPPGNIGIWMIVLFLARTGASFVESTSESYFFKHVTSENTNKMSFFRMAGPFASVLAALVGSSILLRIEFSFIFIILGFLMLPGIFFTLQLKDTK